MKTKSILITIAIGVCFTSLFSQTNIDYLGQTPPGTTLTKFAPGIISITGTGEFGDYVTFSPDGDEMFNFTYQKGLKYSAKVDGMWSTPKDTVIYENFVPMFAPYKNMIYWTNHNNGNSILKYSIKENGVWSDTMDTHINDANFVSATLDSTLYFKSTDSYGERGIYTSKFNGVYHEAPVPLPFPINDNGAVFSPNDAYVSPDGSYIILYNDGGSMNGNGRAFITFQQANNQWTLPKILLKNTGTVKAHAIVTTSPDGKYLFVMGTLNYTEMDQYWISAEIIESLRPITEIVELIENTDNDNLFVFPNPTSQTIYINLKKQISKNISYTILNMNGSIVKQGRLLTNRIDVADLNKGIYLLSLADNQKSYVKKLMIE